MHLKNLNNWCIFCFVKKNHKTLSLENMVHCLKSEGRWGKIKWILCVGFLAFKRKIFHYLVIYNKEKKKIHIPILDTWISMLGLLLHLHTHGPPPWILRWGGRDSSGQRLISSNGKTKKIAFFLRGKIFFEKFQIENSTKEKWNNIGFFTFFTFFPFWDILRFFVLVIGFLWFL